MTIKKGAMFGLDARIALAIFGALSVISGAALYSAIQNSKAIQVLAQIMEVSKAWEAHYLDTGSDLRLYNNEYRHTIDFAKDNGLAGWNGPYLSFDIDESMVVDYVLYPNSNDIVNMVTANDDTWGNLSDWSINGKCYSGSSCFVWVVSGNLDLEIAKDIDIKIDGEFNQIEGNSRVKPNGDATKYAVFYKVASVKNPY